MTHSKDEPTRRAHRLLAEVGTGWKAFAYFDSTALPCRCVQGNFVGVQIVTVVYRRTTPIRSLKHEWLVLCDACRKMYRVTGGKGDSRLGACQPSETHAVEVYGTDAAIAAAFEDVA